MNETREKIVYMIVLGAYSLFEHWLAKTSRTEAGSAIQLAINTLGTGKMEKVEIKIVAEKEIADLGVALKTIIGAAKAAAKDGFQAGQDIPAVVMASWPVLVEAIKGVDKIADAAKEDLGPVVGAIGACVTEVTQEILKK
jgi:DNA integrity scanning protein DisA with diadenylate cyclase activity